ncbi:MAG: asparagine synthase (glutamine-hydrolyzing) [bacterium]|nr:asparagine synthase (glutamine-hydrolyzing) [bacterium]
MCGITGFIGSGNQDTIRKMADTLRHRGPDEEGFFVDDKRGVHLGFRRLSIIDLSTGSQPIFNEDGTLAAVFNGEIYNYKELRRDLEKRHTFKTQTDTEVIVHLYEEIGERCFEKFNGMFAIAIWDAKKERLVLARDRMGKKPLYWAHLGNALAFGSELKAILAHPAAARKLSKKALLKYFFFLNVPSPWTIFEGMYKLEPGQMLVYQLKSPPAGGGAWGGGSISKSFYWQARYDTDPSITLHDALQEVDRLLEDATRIRLVSDVPLGIFLSGGIDSSIVAYYAARAARDSIKTFSIGFNVPKFDESPYARRVSELIGSEHHVELFDPATLLALLPKIAAFLDEPFSDSSILPTYLLSKFTRKHVTVALGGDGGDELFLGYPTFQAHRIAEWYRVLPGIIQERLLPALAHVLPVRHAGLSFDYKIKAFLFGAPHPVGIRQQAWISMFDPGIAQNIFSEEFLADLPDGTIHEDIDKKLQVLAPHHVDEAAMFLYERYFLGDQVLAKVDRASMAASIEVRAPFLDVRLVEYAHRIPTSLRLRFWQNKYLLKKLMRGKLPDDILDRPKRGFWAPVGPWLKKELVPLCDELFARDRIAQQGIFRYTAIQRLLTEHRSGARDHHRILWSLLMFQLWHDRWL